MNDVRHRQPGETHGYDMGRFQRVVGGDSDLITGVWRVLRSERQGRDDEYLIWPLDVTTWDAPVHRSGMTWRPDDFSARVAADGSVEVSDYRLAPNKKAELDSVMHELAPLLRTVAEASRYDTEQAPYAWGTVSTPRDVAP